MLLRRAHAHSLQARIRLLSRLLPSESSCGSFCPSCVLTWRKLSAGLYSPVTSNWNSSPERGAPHAHWPTLLLRGAILLLHNDALARERPVFVQQDLLFAGGFRNLIDGEILEEEHACLSCSRDIHIAVSVQVFRDELCSRARSSVDGDW